MWLAKFISLQLTRRTKRDTLNGWAKTDLIKSKKMYGVYGRLKLRYSIDLIGALLGCKYRIDKDNQTIVLKKISSDGQLVSQLKNLKTNFNI